MSARRHAHLFSLAWISEAGRQEGFLVWLKKQDIPLVHCHTSGHASPKDLQRYAKAIAAKMLVPIHSFATKQFKEYFDNVAMKEDGQWWEVSRAED